jgi:hypothetical protein
MPSARESRAQLRLLTEDAVETATGLLASLTGSPAERRLILLDTMPDLVGYYSDGSSALAADFYEEERELAGARQAFRPELVVDDRTVKIRRAVAWATSPLFEPGDDDAAAEELASGRLGEVIQLESARPYRSTITSNRQRDPEAVGWRRITSGGCRLCRMLAARGAVYRESTVRFATHPHCNCSAQPVFLGNDTGETASVMQYKASRRNRTPEQQAELRAYLDEFYGAP